jgi:hypothetical protein
MDYIHTWLNKWRMQEFHQKQGDGISPKESCSDAGEGPPERLDTRRHRH